MADETEVVYSYVGDVSSLREATKEAISLLDRYDDMLKRMASSPDFGASKTATTNFQRSISGMIKQVNSLTKSINTAGASVDKSIPDGTALMSGVTKDLADVLSFLDSSTKITSDDLKILTQVMQEARGSIDSVTARAQLLSNSMKPLEQMSVAQSMDKASASAEKAEKHYDRAAQAGFRIQEAYQLANKSAAESAAVFIRAGQSAEKLTGVQAVVQRTRTEMQLLGTQAAMAWQRFASYIDPTGDKIRSLQSKTSTALGKMKSVIAKVSSAFRRNTTEADDNSNSYGNLNNRAKSLLSTLSSIGSRARSASGHFDILTNSVKTLNRAFYTLIGVNIGRWLAESVKQSISYIENLNLFSVATGEAYEESLKFVNSMSELYGMDPSNLMRYAGNFYQLADAISMPDKASAALSLGLTKATNDIASLFNVDVETVFENLSSGMQGMSRAVRKYGMDIRTTTLQQTALSLGLTEQVENMSEANRQGLRFITMMQQANNASGDFARTIETPANQLRIFKEQVTQLGRAIGNFLIGPLATAISYINGFVMALRMVLQFIGSVLGVVTSFFGGSTGDKAEQTLENVSNGIGGVGGAAKEATKELKKMLAPFDELTLLQEPEQNTGGGGGGGGGSLNEAGVLDPAILKAIEEMQWKLDEVEMTAVKVRNAILAFLGFEVKDGAIISWDADVFEQNLINKFPKWTKTIQAVFANWSSIIEGFKAVFRSIGEVLTAVKTKVLDFFELFVNDDSVSSFINNLGGSLQSLADVISNNSDTIANFVIGIVGALAGLKGLASVASLVSTIAPALSNLGSLVSSLGSVASVIGVILAVAAALVVLYKNSESFATAVKTFVGTVIQSLKPLAEQVGAVFGMLWESMQKIWTESLQPMLVSLGDAMAPVLQTLTELWGNLVGIVSGAIESISQVYSESIEPAIMSFLDGISSLCALFETLWVEFVGPVLEYIGSGLQQLMTTVIQPVNSELIGIISSVIELFMALRNNILAPLLNWLVKALGPGVTNVFRDIWDNVMTGISNVGSIIRGLLQILQGVLTFLVGVFTLDWQKAWEGIKDIFLGLWNAIGSALVTKLNAIVRVINTAISLVYNAVISVVNLVLEAVNGIGAALGYTLDLSITASAPQIPYLQAPSVGLANGGVVTSPTVALVGEGRYDEVVMPLGNSPQMNQFADSVASRVNNGEQIKLLRDQNDLLRQILSKTGTYLDGKKISDTVTTYQRMSSRALGV